MELGITCRVAVYGIVRTFNFAHRISRNAPTGLKIFFRPTFDQPARLECERSQVRIIHGVLIKSLISQEILDFNV